MSDPGAENQFRVRSDTSATNLAGAISAVVEKHGFARLSAIGPRAINNCVKAVAIARGHVAPRGLDLVMVPAFFHESDSKDIEMVGVTSYVRAVPANFARQS